MKDGGCQHLSKEMPVEFHVMRLSLLQLRQELGRLVERVFALPRPRAVGGASEERESRVNRAHRAELHFVVARFEADSEVELVQRGVRIEDRAEAVFVERPLLTFIEDQRQVAGERHEIEALDQLDHDGQARLHVGSASPVKQVAFDAGWPVVLGAHRVEVPDEGNSRRVFSLCSVDDQAVMEAGNGVATQAARQSSLDVIAELRFLSNRARNPSEIEQRVAKRIGDFGHRPGA